MTSKARKLRKQSTDAEKRLWHHLRNRQILNAKIRRQHPFPPYIADFVCLETKLIIEIDGSHHMDNQEQDEKRTHFLKAQGFHVIRFWNNEVLSQTEAVLEAIYNELGKHPSPQPSPLTGERGLLKNP